jgi:hypothetical protein
MQWIYHTLLFYCIGGEPKPTKGVGSLGYQPDKDSPIFVFPKCHRFSCQRVRLSLLCSSFAYKSLHRRLRMTIPLLIITRCTAHAVIDLQVVVVGCEP